jgi:hypothetical protein
MVKSMQFERIETIFVLCRCADRKHKVSKDKWGEIKVFVASMHRASTEGEVSVLWEVLKASLADNPLALHYFDTCWWSVRQKWCKCFWPRLDEYDTATNNHIERYHKALKEDHLKNKLNKRLDVLIDVLRGGVTQWFKTVRANCRIDLIITRHHCIHLCG